MTEKAPDIHVYVQPIDIPLALFHLADVMRAVAFGADHHEGRHRSNQERLYAAAKVFADSHPTDSLSNVLMRRLMEPFDAKNPNAGKSMRDRLKVIDGGVKDQSS
jgi:hypothetical protein